MPENNTDSHNHTSRPIPSPPQPPGLRAAFHIRKSPYPWEKAVIAGLGVGVPFVVGALFGQMDKGLLASMGGFVALYIHDDPYPKRAKKLFAVLLGLAAALGLGTLAAVSVWTMALALGFVSFASTLCARAWRVPPPGGYFFMLVCCVATGLPVHPSEALLRVGLLLLGGCFTWVLAMGGWLIRPHGPETQALVRAYKNVANYLAALDTPSLDSARHNATLALTQAEEMLVHARGPWRRGRIDIDRLLWGHHHATRIFLAGATLEGEAGVRVPADWVGEVKRLATQIEGGERSGSQNAAQGSIRSATQPAASAAVPSATESAQSAAASSGHTFATPRAGTHPALRRLVEAIAEAQTALEHPPAAGSEVLAPAAPSVKSVLSSALSGNSLARPAALRNGIAVFIATFIGRLLGDVRPYWVPLSCSSVLQGATVMAIVHRTLQRAIGTSVGVCIAGAILAGGLPPVALAFVVMALQCLVELIIPRNYAIAATFITPMALILAEAGRPGTVGALVEARLLDTLVGCALGLVFALVLWSQASSTRLRPAIARTLRHEAELMRMAGNTDCDDADLSRQARKVQAALVNTRSLFDSAVHELPRQRSAWEPLWPVVVAISRLGLLLMATAVHQPIRRRAVETDEIDKAYEWLKQLADLAQPRTRAKQLHELSAHPPKLSHHPTLQAALAVLADSLQAAVHQLDKARSRRVP
ncbi:FUSC family protein [Alicyclobacillus herbarius]|uniref:FUSC family protein n=1 Tax=Alicyclobacillus herbarius TaxID=122960 RepID=UPI000419A745|nr:FUSC family protein [Alicyclobacillus herbarius]